MLDFLKKKMRPKKDEKINVHFLHIGKTGGSAVKSVLKEHIETPIAILHLHGHGKNLKNVPPGDKAILFLRDPVSRFISGFYSRKRKGQPRYNSEWKGVEEELFNTFETPNELACALADKTSPHHELAERAMRNVRHFKTYDHWCISPAYFKKRLNAIFYIGFQETLDQDFTRLLGLLELPTTLSLPQDDVSAHRNSEKVDKHIDDVGVEALKQWYASDIAFVEHCKALMEKRGLRS